MSLIKKWHQAHCVNGCVLWCADQGSGAADVGRQRQASVSSPGSWALQSAEEQRFTCQVQKRWGSSDNRSKHHSPATVPLSQVSASSMSKINNCNVIRMDIIISSPRLLWFPEDEHSLSRVDTQADCFLNTVLWLHQHLWTHDRRRWHCGEPLLLLLNTVRESLNRFILLFISHFLHSTAFQIRKTPSLYSSDA